MELVTEAPHSYMVTSVDNTEEHEGQFNSSFNKKHHEQYIGQIGC